MAIICIPKHLVSKLKDSALRKEVDITKLYEMSSKNRRDFFAKHTDEELGKFLNTEFEKAVISEQKDAMLNWAKSVFTPKARNKPVYKTVLDKINHLDELGVLDPKSQEAYLEDLVADSLGITVSADEVKAISERARKISDAQEKIGDDLGMVGKEKEQLAFFKAKREMDDYLQSLSPTPKTAVATGVLGRAAMLASIKSPLLNIGSNTISAITEALSRRLAGGRIKGADNKLALKYIKMVNRIYKETGYDISRMTDVSTIGETGSKALGETVHTQGPGALRKVARIAEDVVFKNLMGAPDVAFASAHFADSVNLKSMALAKGNKQKAREIMEDAMRLKPQTPEGEIARGQAIMDAEYATYTNKTWASKASENIRKTLNDVSGDIRFGDYTMPFVKTPANVIAAGVDYSGGGAVKAAFKTIQAIKEGKATTREHWQNITRDLVRSGLGISGALIIANQLNDDDFVGAYDPKRKQIEDLRNTRENSFRAGDKWISVDWLGPFTVPVSAIMYARKYGQNLPDQVFQYAKGTGSKAFDIPGVEEIADLYEQNKSSAKAESLSDATGATGETAVKEITARMIPSFFGDVAKAMDQYERETGGDPVAALKAKIPGLRGTLPIKENIFGEPIKDEGAMVNILFGSRVRTDKEDDLVKEMSRVATENDKGITLTDWKKSSGKQLMQFKQTLGDENFEKARKEYGQIMKQKLQSLVTSKEYQNLDESDKIKEMGAQDADAIKEVFKKYNFKYKRAQ